MQGASFIILSFWSSWRLWILFDLACFFWSVVKLRFSFAAVKFGHVQWLKWLFVRQNSSFSTGLPLFWFKRKFSDFFPLLVIWSVPIGRCSKWVYIRSFVFLRSLGNFFCFHYPFWIDKALVWLLERTASRLAWIGLPQVSSCAGCWGSLRKFLLSQVSYCHQLIQSWPILIIFRAATAIDQTWSVKSNIYSSLIFRKRRIFLEFWVYLLSFGGKSLEYLSF